MWQQYWSKQQSWYGSSGFGEYSSQLIYNLQFYEELEEKIQFS